METLNKYLRDLLIIHDCVILPDFGGFVGSYKSAENLGNNYFSPPRKAIAFNPQLKDNDGLLANTIIAIEGISYENAMQRIATFTATIKKELKSKGTYTIPSVGELKRGEQGRILFFPDATSNFLLAHVGMQSVHMKPIILPKIEKEEEKGRIIAMPLLRKVLVASVSGFTLISLLLAPGKFENLELSSLAPTTSIDNINLKSSEIVSTPEIIPLKEEIKEEEKVVEKEVIAPSEELNQLPKRYHVVVGCFSLKENAEVQKEKLELENIQAKTFKYSNDLIGVSAGSFTTFEEAKTLMNSLRTSGNAPAAWVLKRTNIE